MISLYEVGGPIYS